MGAIHERIHQGVFTEKPRLEPSAELLNTAGHELNHALVAMAMGAKVVGISVEPRGNILGVTTYAGELEPHQIRMIAAAGSVAAHDGHASGFGSDMQKEELLGNYFGGLPTDTIVALSSRIIESYPLAVREEAAKLIALEGHVTGSRLGAILDQARRTVGKKQYQIIPRDALEDTLSSDEKSAWETKVAFRSDGNISYLYLGQENGQVA